MMRRLQHGDCEPQQRRLGAQLSKSKWLCRRHLPRGALSYRLHALHQRSLLDRKVKRAHLSLATGRATQNQWAENNLQRPS